MTKDKSNEQKVKNLVEKEIGKRIGDIDGVAVINPRGSTRSKTT